MPAVFGFEGYVWTDIETQTTLDSGLHFRRIYDYCGRVRGVYDANGERWTLKSVDHDSQELHILRTLLADSSSSNHTLPTEIIPCGDTYLLLMPDIVGSYSMIWESFDKLLGAIQQYLQGLEFMHQHGIAHLDIHAENLLYAERPHRATGQLAIRRGRAYFIDFGLSKRFSPVSGFNNGTIAVPFQKDVGHYDPPEGIESVNPYAYDVYCMGWVINYFCFKTTNCYGRLPHIKIRVTPAIWAFSKLLSSESPQERPSATHALAILGLLKTWLKMTRWLYWFLPYRRADGIELCGWYIIRWIIHSNGALSR